MKKIFLVAVSVVSILCSCSTYELNNTVWYNLTEGELNNQKGNIITSLYFFDDHQMAINTCVEKDSVMIVKPITTAFGDYTMKGNLKDGINLTINMKDIHGIEQIRYGIITNEGMLLTVSDSIARTFTKIKGVTLK